MGGGASCPLYPLRAAHLLECRGDGRDRCGQHQAPPVHHRHVARRVHAAAAHQAAQSCNRHHAGAAHRCRLPGRGAQEFRHAIDPRRRRRRSGQGPRRQPRLQVGHPGIARRPRGRDDRRRARGKSAPRRPRHRHGGKAVGQADPPRCDRHQTLRRAQLLEPNDDQPALLAPGLRNGSPRACTTRGDHGRAGGLPASGRRRAEPRHQAGLCPGGLRSHAGHAGGARREELAAWTGAQGLPQAHQFRAAGGAAATRHARAARQRGPAAAQRASRPAQREAAGRPARLVSCRQRG